MLGTWYRSLGKHPARRRKLSHVRTPHRQARVEILEQRWVFAATLGFNGAYELDNWSNEVIANGTTTIDPASGAADEAAFSYDLTLGGTSFAREQTVDFLATAAATGTVTFDYEFTGISRFHLAFAQFEGLSGSGVTPIVDRESTFGKFAFSGSASFIAQQGENLGFRIGGGNSDSNRAIDGELRITNIVFHDEILTPIIVDTDTDIDDGDISPGNLSLREAMRLANEAAGDDTILFDPSLAGSTITIINTSDDVDDSLKVRSSITIHGLGADQLTISGGGHSRVFSEDTNGTRIINITDMTIADGLAPGGTGGGAFFTNGGQVTFERVVMTGNNSLGNNGSTIVAAFGTLTIADSAIVGNLNTGVGAIRLQDSTMVVTNTTISGNGTRGISFFKPSADADSVTLRNVTIANNANEGIEIVAFAGTTLLEYENTIIATNGGQGSIDARGDEDGLLGLSIVSLGHNLLDDTPVDDAAHDAAAGDLRNTDPLLGPLANNGGPVPTHALLIGSPAIDAGSSTLPTDGRGFYRPIDVASVPNASGGNGSDIGAFEAFSFTPITGDYDRSGTVDQADYAVWKASFGATGLLPADGNGDGRVNLADYVVWRNNLGATLEPLTAALAAEASEPYVSTPDTPTLPSLFTSPAKSTITRQAPTTAESPSTESLAAQDEALLLWLVDGPTDQPEVGSDSASELVFERSADAEVEVDWEGGVVGVGRLRSSLWGMVSWGIGDRELTLCGKVSSSGARKALPT